jgi:hypothetical protein
MSLILLPDLLPDRLKVVEDLGLGIEDELPVAAVDLLKAGSQGAEDARPGGGVKVLRRTTRYGPFDSAAFGSLAQGKPSSACGFAASLRDIPFQALRLRRLP